jgi:hypothetical protein
MSNSPTVNSSSYSDGASYGVQEVIAKGWPMPSQNGGKRKHTTNGICKLCKKRHQKGCSCKGRRTKKGGFVNEAIVPFGLFALQKRTQGKRGHKSAKNAKSFRRSRKNRRSVKR